jgi:hypothetical protein
MEPEIKGLVTRIRPPEHLVSIDVRGATVKMYVVSEDKLDLLSSSGSNSINLALFTLVSGIAVTLIITLYTVDITDPIKRATFWAVFWAMSILTLYFGINAVRDLLRARRLARTIKEVSPIVGVEKPLN